MHREQIQEQDAGQSLGTDDEGQDLARMADQVERLNYRRHRKGGCITRKRAVRGGC